MFKTITLSFLMFLLFGCFACDYDLELEKVKSLSPEQLKDIHSFFEAQSMQLGKENSVLHITSELSIPHISPVVGRVTKKGANVVIGGCMDDKSYLHISGFSGDTKQPRISVDWGDGPDYEELELWIGD